MISAVTQQPPLPQRETKDVIVRPKVEHPPSVWGDYFIHLPPSFDQESKSWMQQRIQKLKEEVRRMLRDENDLLVQLSTIDTLQRLGVGCHFEEEIKKILDQVYEARLESKDLYVISLRFRLLRQEGYNIATDEFNIFMDEDGNFLEALSGDVEGLLCLYEATYLATHGEVILDKANEFCRNHLKAKLNQVEPEVAMRIEHTLEIPLHRRYKRLEARYYISIYEKNERRIAQLLELAKLDFNLWISLHQEEIKIISEWWKELGFATTLPFARDRIPECYFWVLGLCLEPSLSLARIMTTKVIVLTSIMDDIYDTYGTVEELEAFTDVLQRWDGEVPYHLPEYLKIYLSAYVRTLKEFEDELAKDGHSCRVNFLKKEINDLAMAYFEEAKWISARYVPPFKDHFNAQLITAVYPLFTCSSFLWMGDIPTNQVFDWIRTFPKILKASSVIGRFMNDIVSYEREKKQVHCVCSIQCYMKEHCTSFEGACVKIQEMVEDAWKDINQELLMPTIMPIPLLEPIINLARISVTFYKDGDDYTYSAERTKDRITLLIVQPIPI